MTDKKNLRAWARSEAECQNPELSEEADRLICKKVTSLPEFENAGRVFAFAGVFPEPDTSGIIEKALDMGKTVALPVTMSGGEMEFAVYTGETVKGMFGISEPLPDAERIVPMCGDIMLVPGVCFDIFCRRLGRGGGYYDRYLSGCGVFTVGLCRDIFLVNEVPAQEHDIPVQMVITEKRSRGPTRAPRKKL